MRGEYENSGICLVKRIKNGYVLSINVGTGNVEEYHYPTLKSVYENLDIYFKNKEEDQKVDDIIHNNEIKTEEESQ